MKGQAAGRDGMTKPGRIYEIDERSAQHVGMWPGAGRATGGEEDLTLTD